MAAPIRQVLDPEKEKKDENMDNNPKDNFKKAVYLGTITGISLMFGFGTTIALAKKKDPSMFAKGLFPSREAPESGGRLAVKALGWGTLYAVSGVSLFCFGIWKLLGVKNMEEFSSKMQPKMPSVPKKPIEEQGRNDFKTVEDVVEYILEEDRQSKVKKS